MEFTKPVLAYAEIWPLIAVLGVACLGVLAEALLARPHRHRAQVLLAGTGLVAALVGTVVVGTRLDEVADGAARGVIGGAGSVVVDGPTVFLWALVLVFSLMGLALFAERKVEAGVSVFAGQAAALPGSANLAHKTGTLSRTASDIGLFQTADGRTIAAAIYVTGQSPSMAYENGDRSAKLEARRKRDLRINSITGALYEGFQRRGGDGRVWANATYGGE